MTTTDAGFDHARTVPTSPIGQVHHDWPLLAAIGWVFAAAGVGFGVTFIGSGLLHLPRPWLVLVLLVAVSLLTAGYAKVNHLEPGKIFRNRWVWASVRGVLLGAVLIALTLPPDDSSRLEGTRLLISVIWLGLVYGTVDALLLNVLPMMAIWHGLTQAGITKSWPGKIGGGVLSIAANLLVTTAYHLGYQEFQSPDIWAQITGPLGGNFIIGVGYVLAPNPLTSIVSHIILHIASVLSGSNGPVQLPPHY